MDQDLIDNAAADLDDTLIAVRRDLNAHPEGPGQEARTAATVAQMLATAGLVVTSGIGGHGVVGILRGNRLGRTVAYRADMDAVPAEDGSETAHLCGHDLHTTIAIGIALTLARLRDQLAGTIVFIFQPAEENLTGAQSMLDDGVLDLATPAEIHALHCGPIPVGTFLLNPGTGLPGQDQSLITLTGAGARNRVDHLVANLNALSTIARPETSDELETLIKDLQTPDGPLAQFAHVNAWPGRTVDDQHAEVHVAVRCWPEDHYTVIRQGVAHLGHAVGPARLTFPDAPFPAMLCPEQESHALHGYLQRSYGPNSAQLAHAAFPFNGEDFALFLQQLPGTYTYLGVRSPGADIKTCSPHHPAFKPDERAIGIGVRAMTGWLTERARA